MFRRLLVVFALFSPVNLAGAEKITPDQKKFFEEKIRPALVEHCYECHATGAKKLGAGLVLDSAPALERGGESGNPVVPGKPEESLLFQALLWKNDLEMPPQEPLSEEVIDHFRKWIAMGAPDPRTAELKLAPTEVLDSSKYRPEDLWSFQPILSPEPPQVENRVWPRSPLDQFILAKLEEKGIAPAEDATAEVLLRRLYFDLIGLPPSFSEQEAFVRAFQEDRSQAVARQLDTLLASPHFGEKWGRHWLDVARYAESNGNDGLSRNASFPHAWRYRDYVIGSFNGDLPYDAFLTQQIAGDLLEASSERERDDFLIATGFLALGAKPAKAMNEDFDMDVVADQIDVIGSGLLGLSIACARCHDHKTDPIPTRDYYALAGFFTSTETLWGIAANERLTAPPTQLHLLKSYPNVPASAEAIQLMKETEAKEMRNYPRPGKDFTYPAGAPLAMGVRDRKSPDHCRINLKGSSKALGGVVPRGVLTAYPDPKLSAVSVPTGVSGRKELAAWLVSPNHPQTARVMVNRIWLHLFGQGIVTTPDDFGVYGEKPTHPELLDYLATRFKDSHQWSVKSVIREMVLSRTYQLSSEPTETSQKIDPENQRFSRHHRKRLDAEQFRDAVLKVCGTLNAEPGQGSAIRHLELLVNRAPDLHQPSCHRSVYLCLMRNSSPQDLAAFDLPEGIKPTGQRLESILPTQALFLMNSSFLLEQSRALGRSLESDSAAGRVDELWRKVFNRLPSADERTGALSLIENIQQEEDPWQILSQALLATNEFRYVD